MPLTADLLASLLAGGSRDQAQRATEPGFSESQARKRPLLLFVSQPRLRGLLALAAAFALAPRGPQPRACALGLPPRCPLARGLTADHCQLSSSRGDGDQAALTC